MLDERQEIDLEEQLPAPQLLPPVQVICLTD